MITLYLIKGSAVYDITCLCNKVTWTGRRGSPARSVTATLIDDPSVGDRPKISIRDGHFFLLKEGKTELFRGLIEKVSKNSSGMLSVTAYDSAIFLSNNRDTFSYKKKTLTNIFKSVCDKYGIAYDEPPKVKYKIPVLAKDKTTIYDVLCEAMALTYKKNGQRYYVASEKGRLKLIKRSENKSKVVLSCGDYDNTLISSYSLGRDISNTKTREKLLSKNGKVVVTVKDKKLEKKIGQRQDIDNSDQNKKKAKLKKEAKQVLKTAKLTAETLSITAIGDNSVIAGKCVLVKLQDEDINRAFYVESDTHTWEGEEHLMQVTLNFATDINSIE